MYVSCLVLNTAPGTEGAKLMKNRNRVHGLLNRGFPNDGASDYVHRVDTISPYSAGVLVQSNVEPDWDKIYKEDPHLFAVPPFPINRVDTDQFQTGQKFRFRININAVYRSFTKNCMYAVKNDDLEPWFHKKAEKHGFKIQSMDITDLGSIPCFKKNRKPIKYRSVLYEGTLTVDDLDKFKNAVLKGIGKAKFVGLGALTVVPLP